MRLMLVAALASTCGCDQLFGINGTKLADAPPGTDGAPNPDVPLGTLFLTQLQLVSAGSGSEVVTTDGAISPAPTIELGTLTGPLTATTYEANGTFQVPFTLAGQPYRLVYQLAGDIPTEIQWSRSAAHLTVPAWGPTARDPVPTGAGVLFTPTSMPAVLKAPLVFSTGEWTTGTLEEGILMETWHYSTAATSFSGALGSLSAPADNELLVDYTNTPTTGTPTSSAANGFAWMSVPALIANQNVNAASTWATTPQWNVMWSTDTLGTYGRMSNDGVESGGATTYLNTTAFAIPSTSLPMLTFDGQNGALDSSVAIPLAYVTSSTSPITFVNPFTASPVTLPIVLETSFAVRKAIGGVLEYSGFEEVGLASDAQLTDQSFNVGFATTPTINGAVWGDTDMVDVSAPTITFAFNVDVDQNDITARTDDCIATLNSNGGFTLTPIRRYQVLDFPASITVDTSMFTQGTSYVFRIQCRRGYPLARTIGDYRTIDYPFEVGVAFTPTFVAMK